MKIVILEDEQPALKRLVKLLNETVDGVDIIAHHDSVAGAEQWFGSNDMPDLVMMDIHLADGSAFDLLNKVAIKAPIVFTTAFDEYAIEAFKASSIGYLLKPIKKESLKEVIDKLDGFKTMFKKGDEDISKLFKQQDYKKRFLIRFGEHIKTIPVEEIAYFYSENKATFAKTFEGRTYPMDQNLDALEHVLDPEHFFRLNRQYIISMGAIDEMKAYSKARVVVKLNPETKEQPIVSSERSATFKQWLAGEL